MNRQEIRDFLERQEFVKQSNARRVLEECNQAIAAAHVLGDTLLEADAYAHRAWVNFNLQYYEAALADYRLELELNPDAYLTPRLILELEKRQGVR